MKWPNFPLIGALLLLPALIVAQGPSGLDPASLLKPLADSWLTYSGDYTGRRYSTLKQINAANVKSLTLAWVYRLNTSRAGAIVGGEGPDTPPPGSPMLPQSSCTMAAVRMICVPKLC